MKLYGALAIIALAIGIYFLGYTKGHATATQDWEIRWNKSVSDHMEENYKAQVRMREKEQEWQRLFDEVSKDAIDKINTLESDLAAASASADSLRNEAREYASRARRCSQDAGANTQTAPDAGLLLADLFGELAERAKQYAAEADRRGIAGHACQSLYLSVSQ